MAISVEWILNKSKQKIYAVSHAKAVVRGTGTVDTDLAAVETDLETLQTSVNALQTDVDNLDLTAISGHLTQQINSEAGIHGLRYFQDMLQYFNGTTWIEIETGASGIPPADMISVSANYGSDGTKVLLRGTDPNDITSDGAIISRWGGTKIVRKTGSFPTKPTDGVLVVDYQTKNQYQTAAFEDTGLVLGETYYYRWFPYSDTGAIKTTGDDNTKSITTRNYTVYGVKADWANNTYTRLESAIGKTAGANFDDVNAFGGRKRCIVTDDRKILAFHGESGYTETGKLTVAVTKDGTSYAVGTSVQVMVYQPKFYYKVTPVTKVANPHGTGFMIRAAEYYVSDTLYEGFKVHPAFVRNGVEIPYILLSAFEASTQNSNNTYVTNNASLGNRLSSIAGAKPATGSDGSNTHSFTRNIARSLAAARGTGWQIGDGLTAALSQMLFTIEFGDMNSQTVLDQGNVNNTGSYAGVLATGGTSHLGNASGFGAGDVGKRCVSYRGEENLWGNVWTWQDGLNCHNSNVGIAYWADSNFSDDTTSSPYKTTGFNFARTNGYISAYGYSDSCDFMFIPCEVSGDTALPVGDYFYQNASSSTMTVAFLGGGCGNGLLAGLFDWAVHNVSSRSGWSIGSRVVCVPNAT